MRIFVWLTIAVFISTLFWPQLLNATGILSCIVVALFMLVIPHVRRLAIIPVAAIYFSCYANITLTGKLPLANVTSYFPFTNSSALQEFVDGQDHAVIVQVNSLINQKNKGYFTAKLIALDNNHLNYAPLIEMRWYNPTVVVQAGQKHAFKVRFKPVYGRANPAGFDRQKWRYSGHIAYQASIKAHIAEFSTEITLRAQFYRLIQQLSAGLDNQGNILALAFADKTLMAREQQDSIKKLGISHLFAISGLHIGLLFSLAYALGHLLVRRFFPSAWLGWFSWRLINTFALAAAFCYAYLAGFSLPTQRAFLMLLIAVVLLSMKRRCGLVDLLSVTLLIILLWDPLAVLSISLWLSFSAVAIILTILWRFPELTVQPSEQPSKSRFLVVGRYLKFLVCIQFFLTLLMLPIQLFNFSAFNGLAPLINLIAVPLFSLVIIPLILLGCLLALFVPPLARLCFFCADQILTLFFDGFTGLDGAYQSYSLVDCLLISVALLVLGTLYLLYHQTPTNQKINLQFATVGLLFVSVSLWPRQHPAQSTWYIETIDVGQGLAVLVRTATHTLLYDTGPRYPSGFNTATTEIVPYLQALGVTQLDYLVISHSDIDHAGGVAVIMTQFTPKNIILGEPLNEPYNLSGNYQYCRTGQAWNLGALSVRVLAPTTLDKRNNNNSCVLRVSDSETTLLLTGDIEKKQEMRLLATQPGQLASDIVFAPHHGSKHSSSRAFIEAVAPRWVVFSAGFMNRWHFPAEEVKLRYKNQSTKMVNSGLSGFIRFKITKGEIMMQTYREDLAAYWYHHSFSL